MVQSTLKRFFDPRGRIGRSEMLLIGSMLIGLELLSSVIDVQSGSHGTTIVFFLKCLMFTVGISATIKRLHDMNYSGWWVLGGAAMLCMWTAIIAIGGLFVMGRDILQPGSSGHLVILGLVMLPAIAITLWLHVAEGYAYKNVFGTPPDAILVIKSTSVENNLDVQNEQSQSASSITAV